MSGYKYRIAAAALAALFLVSLAWRGLKVGSGPASFPETSWREADEADLF